MRGKILQKRDFYPKRGENSAKGREFRTGQGRLPANLQKRGGIGGFGIVGKL
jgi:hypothetical protein